MISENTIYNAGQNLGGAVGHGIDAGCNGYNAYHDAMGGNWTGAAEQAGDALVNGAEAWKDGEKGEWVQ